LLQDSVWVTVVYRVWVSISGGRWYQTHMISLAVVITVLSCICIEL